MPTYEYRCDACGEVFEYSCSVSDHTPETVCPECGGPARQRVGAGVSVSMGTGGAVAGQRRGEASPDCGKDSPCCGKDTVCDTKPCHK